MIETDAIALGRGADDVIEELIEARDLGGLNSLISVSQPAQGVEGGEPHGGLLGCRPQQAEFRIELLVVLAGRKPCRLIGLVVVEAVVTQAQREVKVRERRDGGVQVRIVVAAVAAAVFNGKRESAEIEYEYGARALIGMARTRDLIVIIELYETLQLAMITLGERREVGRGRDVMPFLTIINDRAEQRLPRREGMAKADPRGFFVESLAQQCSEIVGAEPLRDVAALDVSASPFDLCAGGVAQVVLQEGIVDVLVEIVIEAITVGLVMKLAGACGKLAVIAEHHRFVAEGVVGAAAEIGLRGRAVAGEQRREVIECGA